MAAPARKFIAALARYGGESGSKYDQLVAWKDAALQSMAENQGGQIASGSVNGRAFGLMPSGMTNAEWFAAIDEALAWIQAGVKPPSRTYAIVR